jgi:uncharacterized lipoprotein NlpE involved in copper resistance
MTKKILILISMVGIMLSACNSNENFSEKTVYIGAETALCSCGETSIIRLTQTRMKIHHASSIKTIKNKLFTDEKQKECLQIKWTKDQKEWELFYGEIKGFTYEKGNEYELIISEEKVDDAPADASCKKYKLVKEIYKKKVETRAIIDEHNSKNSVDWAGIYQGTLPCADCEGIKTSITLNQDYTYTLTEEYIGKKGNPIVAKGSFIWDDNGGKIALIDGGRKQQYKVGENRLFHLDLDGNVIEGRLADKYILLKKESATTTTSIEDKTWKLVNFMGKDIREKSNEYYIIFNSKEHNMHTKVGCNLMRSNYNITDEFKLKFDQLISTKMSCPNGSFEKEYIKHLATVDNYTTNGEKLQLNKARITIATFQLSK